MAPEDKNTELSKYNPNDLAGLVYAESLFALGLTEIVISPGARSTPLTYAFAVDPRLKTHVVLDERSAGFFALGIAKRKNIPVVLLCTSGSACANYLPAILEARYSHTPLIVLTADRPIVDRECHSGQTIKQPGIFQSYVNWELDVSEPESNIGYIQFLRETLKQAFRKSLYGQPGVVHLNIPLKDPLTPQLSDLERSDLKDFLATIIINNDNECLHALGCCEKTNIDLSHYENVLLVAGPIYEHVDSVFVRSLAEFTKQKNIPLLADSLNPFRNTSDLNEITICNYDIICRNKDLLKELKPDLIIQVSHLPTSKILRQVLADWDAPRIQIGGVGDSLNSVHFNTIATCESPDQLIEKQPKIRDNRYLKLWKSIDEEISDQIREQLADAGDLSESVFCHQISNRLDARCDLFIANSMILRDMDAYWHGSSCVKRVFSSRGVNGIDGIIGTMIGASSDLRPLLCLVGDLSFIHDASSLNLSQNLKKNQRIIFVVLDNNGGGIFEHLEVAKLNPPFESHFATPQKVNIKCLCESYNIEYLKRGGVNKVVACLNNLLKQKSSDPKVVCLHVEFNRKTSSLIRKNITKNLMK